MTIILAIDSATGPCSTAVWKDGRIAAYLENPKPAAQSAVLMPMIEEALKRSGIDYSDLSHLAATIGPGSFTGIRVGLAAARGIAFTAGIKTLGFTTLEVMAFAARAHKTPILAILNAGKGEYYYQLFGTAIQHEPHLGNVQEIMQSIPPETHIISNVPGIGHEVAFPSASALAELAATQAATAHPPVPFYIRPPDAKLPVRKA